MALALLPHGVTGIEPDMMMPTPSSTTANGDGGHGGAASGDSPPNGGSGSGGNKAVQACATCRRQKRRCDKALPSCGLCARLGRVCDYSVPPVPGAGTGMGVGGMGVGGVVGPDGMMAPAAGAAVATAEDVAALRNRLAELENRLAQREGTGTGTGGGSGGPVAGSGSGPGSGPGSGSGSGAMGMGFEWPAQAPVTGRFPAALFLDIDCFRWSGMPMPPPKPAVDVPLEVLDLLLSHGPGGVQEVAGAYFRSVHPWFPVVSRKRMSLGLPLRDGGADLAALFLAMKLVTSNPVAPVVVSPSPPAAGGAGAEDMEMADGPGNEQAHTHHQSEDENNNNTNRRPETDAVYAAAKRCLALLEASGAAAASLLYLQALLLVALYEYGHAIYPAAWMTVGACARAADMLGLPALFSSDATTTILGACSTWTEAEERRRVWWGIYILDRAISMGSKMRFAAREPSEADVLPVDDAVWDDGDMTRAFQRPVSTPLSTPASPFARTCQAAMLVSKAVQHALGARATQRSVFVGGGGGSGGEEGGSRILATLKEAAALSDSIAELCRLIDEEMAAAAATVVAATSSSSSSSVSTAQQQPPPLFSPPPPPTSLFTPPDSLAFFPPSASGSPPSYVSLLTSPSPASTSAAASSQLVGLMTARGLAWSALVLTLDAYSCPDHLHRADPASPAPALTPAETEALNAQVRASIGGLGEVSRRVRDFGAEILLEDAASPTYSPPSSSPHPSPSPPSSFSLSPPEAPAPTHPRPQGGQRKERVEDKIGPLVLDSVYCALACFRWMWKEAGGEEAARGADDARRTLALFARRWGLAGEYLALERHHDLPAPCL